MHKSLSLAPLIVWFLITGCSPSSSGTTTLTMYLSETDIGACDPSTSDFNGPVDIGGLRYMHNPYTGLVCVSGDDGEILRAFLPESNTTATHRWVQESGSWILGTKHTFEPVPRPGES